MTAGDTWASTNATSPFRFCKAPLVDIAFLGIRHGACHKGHEAQHEWPVESVHFISSGPFEKAVPGLQVLDGSLEVVQGSCRGSTKLKPLAGTITRCRAA
jgi:hypothetical protein